MSKFGWDLPPGCRNSDIPGNRPQDIADEQIRDNIESALTPLGLYNIELTTEDQEKLDQVTESLFKLINNAWESGYQAARSDADEERYYNIEESICKCCGSDLSKTNHTSECENNETALHREQSRGEEQAP
jgi:hypothetical protein